MENVMFIMAGMLMLIVYGASMLLAFLIGAKTAQNAYEKDEITVPNMNPIKAIENHLERVENNKEQERINTMLDNINNYRGDGIGQKEIV